MYIIISYGVLISYDQHEMYHSEIFIMASHHIVSGQLWYLIDQLKETIIYNTLLMGKLINLQKVNKCPDNFQPFYNILSSDRLINVL